MNEENRNGNGNGNELREVNEVLSGVWNALQGSQDADVQMIVITIVKNVQTNEARSVTRTMNLSPLEIVGVLASQMIGITTRALNE